MRARGYFEEIDHPVVGTHPVASWPFRYANVERWLERCRARPALARVFA